MAKDLKRNKLNINFIKTGFSGFGFKQNKHQLAPLFIVSIQYKVVENMKCMLVCRIRTICHLNSGLIKFKMRYSLNWGSKFRNSEKEKLLKQ